MGIRCPVYNDICYDKNPWMCNGHGMLDRHSKECVCNAGYIGCDCLYDDTAENREKYPYSDHAKCQQYNVMKEAVFEHAPVGNGQHSRIDNNEADILHDIIWNEIDVHFGTYHLILFNVKMDLESKKKYVLTEDGDMKKKNKEQFNLDFIQVAKNIKLLIAIPLKIDESKVWIDHYQIIPTEETKQNGMYNVDMSLTFTNQQQMSNQQLEYQMNKILPTLFGESVTMESMPQEVDQSEEVDDAKIDYPDNQGEITFGSELEHNSQANKVQCIHLIACIIVFAIGVV